MRTAVDDVLALLPSFERSLKARNRSPKTIRGYVESARLFAAFLGEQGMPQAAGAIHREHVEAFIGDQLERWTPSTAATRYRYLQQFFRWLEEEGEIAASPMARMKPPTVPETPVPVLGDDELRRLLAACDGRGYEERRDAAVIRLFLDCGLRLAELTSLKVDDVARGPSSCARARCKCVSGRSAGDGGRWFGAAGGAQSNVPLGFGDNFKRMTV